MEVLISNGEFQEGYSPIEEKGAKRVSRGWTCKENKIYVEFLRTNYEVFMTTEGRKKFRVFSALASMIHGRSTAQVKSHHQKMMKSHKGSLLSIIQDLERRFQRILTGAQVNELELQNESLAIEPMLAEQTSPTSQANEQNFDILQSAEYQMEKKSSSETAEDIMDIIDQEFWNQRTLRQD